MLKRVRLVIKRNKPEAQKLAEKLIHRLQESGVEVFPDSALVMDPGRAQNPPQNFPDDFDLIVVLGGDGTLLTAVREVRGGSVPILGINLGDMGFLTEIGQEELDSMVDRILCQDFSVSRRMMLSVKHFRGERLEREGIVLNDVVINKSALARIVNIKTTIDDDYLTTFRADGLIICTPTGSTGYSLSAGGPIIYPMLKAIAVIPICPHTLTHRPLILSDQVTVRLTLETETEDVTVTYDGQTGERFLPGDLLEVTQATESAYLIKSPFKDYFQILRTKLKWGER